MASSLFFNVTLAFSVNNILVAIAAILQIVYIHNGVCFANKMNLIEAIILLIITSLLLLISSGIMYGLKRYILEKISISVLLCISTLWLIQYALIIHSFIAFCDSSSAMYILFLIWTIIYSLVIIIGIIIIIFAIKIHLGVGIALLATACIIVLIIAIIATILQLYLITSGECNYNAISMVEGIFLLVFIFLSICIGVLPFSSVEIVQDYIKIVLCAEFILLAFQYGIINHAVDVWGRADVYCGKYDILKEVTFILMIIWTCSYSLILLFMCCGGLLWCCGQVRMSEI